MEYRIGDALIHFVAHGEGVPLVALHGAGVDHREIEAAVEDALRIGEGASSQSRGLQRIYPDLPGMGLSTADGLTGNADVVTALCSFLDHLDAGPVLLLGHSYGAYLARGVAARRPDAVRGLALVCPAAETSRNVPRHEAVRRDADAYDELEPAHRAGFDEYFVVRTRATARRYRDAAVPGQTLVDEVALGRLFARWTLELDSHDFAAPTLILAGRRDSIVGHVDATALLTSYPHATLAVVDDAGHALMHERPALFAALLDDWLVRARSGTG